MQLKPITAIIILSLVVASLFVSGCTTLPGSNNSTPPNGAHIFVGDINGEEYIYYNGIVPEFVDNYHKTLSAEQTPTYKLTDWRQSRIDLTTMSVYWVWSNTTGNKKETQFVTATAKLFPTNSDALSFVKAHNVGMVQNSERNFFTIDSMNSYETKSRFVTYADNFVIYGDSKIDAY